MILGNNKPRHWAILATVAGCLFAVCCVAFFDAIGRSVLNPAHAAIFFLAAFTNGIVFIYGMFKYLDS